MFERPRGRDGEVTGETTFSLSRFSDFEGVECSEGWRFSLSRPALPFSTRRTSGEAHAVDDESSGVSPEGFGVFTSSSPLDEGEGRSLSLFGGGGSRAAGVLIVGTEFELVEAAEAAERRLFSAVAKTSSLAFGSGIDPIEEVVAEEDLGPSIRDKTESTVFLF